MHNALSPGIFVLALLSAHTSIGLAENTARSDALDLGSIADRPPAPEFPYDHFFQTRELSNLKFAPDNRTVYFIKNDGHVNNVFAIDLASRAMRRITRYSQPVAEFLVDHKGRYLITVQDVGGNESYDLYRYELGSGKAFRLTEAGEDDLCVPCGLSPDDAFVYYTQSRDGRSEADLWRADVSTGEATLVLAAKGRMLECETISADGRYLLFGELVGRSERHLGILDLVSSRAHYIIREPGLNNLDTGFAGRTVYFRSAKASDRFRLWQYKVGDQALALADLPLDNDLESLSLHTGGRIAVVSYRTALASRTAVFLDGFRETKTFRLPPHDIVGAVFSQSDPELGIVFTENAATPRRFHLLGPDGPQILYDSNQSGIDKQFFAESRSLRVPSFDGLEIPVHVFIPNGTSADSPRPVVFWIHGGPEDHIDPVFMSRIQALANRGFVVVAPNVRGSTGYGKAYSFLDNGDWGGAHIRDIVEVAKSVRSLEFVDRDNLLILGASFGGFSVMSLITQYPQVFSAAINVFGITELASFVDSWPPYVKKRLFAELGFDPAVDHAKNRVLSPLYHVDRIKIPLQVHQGANDRRVPRAQSDRLVKRMRQLGLSVEYYVYPDEGHGFRRFQNERAAFTRMVEFLKRQIK